MSDQYGQVGPDKPDYDDDLTRIASLLRHGSTVDVLFTARLTAKHVVLARLAIVDIIGARPQGFAEYGDALFVGIDNGQAGWMPMAEYLHEGYVARYLGHSWGDGSDDHPFADFLNELIKRLVIPTHSGTFGTSSGRMLIDHTAGVWLGGDPLGDNCPLCVDPNGCPRNATSSRDCALRLASLGAAEQAKARATVCPAHGIDK